MNNNLNGFFSFLNERYNIYLKKEIKKEKYPWTDNIILQKYQFCNIFREWDAGTKIVLSLENSNNTELLTNIFCYRIFNRRDHFKKIKWININNWDRNIFKEHLIECIESGPIFSNAYLTNWSFNNILDGIEYIIYNNPDYRNFSNPNDVYKEILKIKCVGPFLGYQLFLDLSYFNNRFHRFNGNDFVVIGPGSLNGIKIIYDNQDINNDLAIKLIYNIRDEQQYLYNYNLPELTLSAIEHSLCEYRKFFNLSAGLGKKRKYYYDV